MARLRYKFNPETLLFETTRTSNRKKIIRLISGFVVSLVLALGYYSIYAHYFETPKTIALQRENANILAKYDILNKQFQVADRYLNRLQRRDNNVYRATVGLDTVPFNSRYPAVGGIVQYPKEFEGTRYEDLLGEINTRLKALKYRAAVQSVSLDTIEKLAARTELMKDCIPAIPPTVPDAVRLTDVFRWRVDPIYGDVRHHDGVDLAGAIGTPVFATGNGVVIKVESSYFGYGRNIMIDHGFGYATLYAHLSSMKVVVGQEVKRGEQIGMLGNTGKSSGPHLHYEVRYRDKKTDPLKYYTNTIKVEEYEKILQATLHSTNEY